ncbi:MAG: recombinase family protein, partial [Clostridia bacterium]|nr:recombinase family protein [Clostridia bacterium]
AHANEARMNEVLGTLDVLKNHPIDYDDSVTRKLVDCIKVVSKNELLVIFKGGIEKTIRME